MPSVCCRSRASRGRGIVSSPPGVCILSNRGSMVALQFGGAHGADAARRFYSVSVSAHAPPEPLGHDAGKGFRPPHRGGPGYRPRVHDTRGNPGDTPPSMRVHRARFKSDGAHAPALNPRFTMPHQWPALARAARKLVTKIANRSPLMTKPAIAC